MEFWAWVWHSGRRASSKATEVKTGIFCTYDANAWISSLALLDFVLEAVSFTVSSQKGSLRKPSNVSSSYVLVYLCLTHYFKNKFPLTILWQISKFSFPTSALDWGGHQEPNISIFNHFLDVHQFFQHLDVNFQWKSGRSMEASDHFLETRN